MIAADTPSARVRSLYETTLKRRMTANRANIATHTGKSIFEPDIATTTTREEFEEMAEHFTIIEMLVRELRMSGRFRVSSFVADSGGNG